MSRDTHRSWYVTGALVLSLIVPTLAGAQSPWLSAESRSVSLEALRPSIDDETVSTFSMAYFLTGRYGLANGMNVVVEVPFSHLGIDPGAGADALGDNTLGNPYVGLEWKPASVPVLDWIEVGLRLPLSTGFGDEGMEDASRVVGVAASMDRMEAFLPDVATLYAMGSANLSVLPLVNLRVRAGGLFDYDTDAPDGVDTSEFIASYALQAWSSIATARVGAGLTGRALVTEGDLDFGERSLHDAGIWADYAMGSFRPGAHVRVPLDEGSTVDYIFGVSLQYTFGR